MTSSCGMTASALLVYVITAAVRVPARRAAKPQPPHSQPPPRPPIKVRFRYFSHYFTLRARALPADKSSQYHPLSWHEFFDIFTEQYGMGAPQTPSAQETQGRSRRHSTSYAQLFQWRPPSAASVSNEAETSTRRCCSSFTRSNTAKLAANSGCLPSRS